MLLECPTGKVVLRTLQAADCAALEIAEKKHIKLVSYKCDQCEWYHLTSKKRVDDIQHAMAQLVEAVQQYKATPVNRLSSYVTRFRYTLDGDEYTFLYYKKYKKVFIEHGPTWQDELISAVREDRATFIERLSKKVTRWLYCASNGHVYIYTYHIGSKKVMIE